MSTKTTFKRIALVAVVALTLGSFSAVSASAARVTAAATPCWISTASTGVLADNETATATATATQVAGASNYVEVTCGTDLASGDLAVVATSGADSTLSTFADASTDALWVSNTAKTSAVSTNHSIASTTFRVLTPTVGTVTTTVAKRVFANGAATETTLQTITITVVSALVANVYSKATVYGFSGDTSTVAAATSTTDAAFAVVASAAGDSTTAQAALFSVLQKDGNDVALTSGWKAITVNTTAGVIQTTYDTASVGGNYVSVTPASASAVGFWLLPNGQTGPATVTISVNGVVVKTYTVTFSGALATLTATVVNAQLLTGSTKTGAVTVVGKDALGNNVIVSPTVTTATAASIASGTCAASTATTASSCDLTAGATVGSSVLTFTSGTIKTTATVAAAAKPTAVTLAFDKAEYAPGEAFTLTLTATNAAGVPGDATYANLLAAALTPSQAQTSTLFGASVALKAGKATATGFMPIASGSFTVTGKTAADATTADAVVSATAGVVNEALDAASEAIDAANAATDAANAAAEAADAATAAAQDAADAVAALSTSVSAMITALKKQITSLTNLVIKIQKKVKA